MSSTLMDDMAEKHNGMFGQVAESNSIRKLFPNQHLCKEQQLVRDQKLLNTTMPILLLPKRAVNNYDLWIIK